MTWELREIITFNVDTIRKPKFEIYDTAGFTTFAMNACTWRLTNSKTKSIILTGNATYNNSDNDLAGNTIKTVQPEIDLTGTDIETGHYTLSFFITLTNGETDVLTVPCEIVELREV